MKTIFLIIGIVGITILNSFSQKIEPDLTYNIEYNGKFTNEQDLEATALLYKEINYYRKVNGIAPLTISKTIVGYACRWGNYMVSRHISPYDNFYEHSTYGPDSLHVPDNTCSEIIHLLYYGHKPSAVEIVSGLMYGIVRNPKSVIGWTQSEDHNRSLLQDIVIYYGASIYVFKTANNWWAVFGTVNFSTVK
jgi:hypothetical protein